MKIKFIGKSIGKYYFHITFGERLTFLPPTKKRETSDGESMRLIKKMYYDGELDHNGRTKLFWERRRKAEELMRLYEKL